MDLKIFTLIIASYLLGSVPFGLLLAKLHGKDLRTVGSGNIGATNVSRALGKKWAYLCFLLDALKGFLPMFTAKFIIDQPPSATALAGWISIGIAAVIGHIFPIYLRFKGGKGVSTCLGVVLGLYPYFTIPGIFAFALWIIMVLIFRYISLASITAAWAFSIVMTVIMIFSDSWTIENLWPAVITSILIPALITVRHRENIKRILTGTEPKILQKK